MDEQDIIDTFEFEWQVANLLLKNKWFYQFTELKVTSSIIDRTAKDGIIRISKTIDRDSKALRQAIKEAILFLYTGTWNKKKYVWQKSALQLGLIKEITADDVCECTLCGAMTPLTKYKRCVPCDRVHRAVRTSPDIARKILAQMEEGK